MMSSRVVENMTTNMVVWKSKNSKRPKCMADGDGIRIHDDDDNYDSLKRNLT